MLLARALLPCGAKPSLPARGDLVQRATLAQTAGASAPRDSANFARRTNFNASAMSCISTPARISTRCRLWNCTHEQYYADTKRDSHSSLEVLRRSWQLYNDLFVSRAKARPEATPALRLGSAMHCILLEPEQFEQRYAVAPEADRRTKAGKERYEEFVRGSHGKTILSRDQTNLAQRMAEKVRTDPVARELLDGRMEQAVRWTDTETGLPLKARWDIFGPPRVIELKSASDPRPEAMLRASHRLGYHRQAALYLDAALALERHCEHRLIAVGTTEPHAVVVYRLTDDALQRGHEDNRRTLQQLARCKNENDWQQYPEIINLDLPRWSDRYNDD
jgi:hypothetical protein